MKSHSEMKRLAATDPYVLIHTIERLRLELSIAVEALESIHYYVCGACEENQKIVRNALAKLRKVSK